MNRVITNYGELHQGYLANIRRVIDRAYQEYPRTFAVRVDLRLPDTMTDSPSYFADTDSAAITRFIASLKAQIKNDLARKQKQGARVHPNTLRYIWAKEYGNEGNKPHYHLLLLLNKDNHAFLGDYTARSGNLASMIQQAWISALRMDFEVGRTLVNFPDQPVYYLHRSSPDFSDVLSALFYRASYLAKYTSKRLSVEERSFGCSQG